jgi:hypothetical protein
MFFADYDTDTDQRPTGWGRIGWGLFGAAMFAYGANDVFMTHDGVYRLDRFLGPNFALQGYGAVAFAVQLSAIALFLHFHYFWAYFPSFALLRRIVARFSLLCIAAATGFVLIYILLHPQPVPRNVEQSAGGERPSADAPGRPSA